MQKYLCGRCCLKTAQGKGRICSHRGFLARPQTPQQHSRCKPRWTPLHGSCFTISFLNPGIQGNSGAWFYSTSGILPVGYEVCAPWSTKCQSLQREQDVEGVWDPPFLRGSALGHRWVSPFFPPKHPNLGAVVANFTGTESPPQLWLLSLATGPGFEVPINFGRGAGAKQVVVIISPKHVETGVAS